MPETIVISDYVSLDASQILGAF